MSSTLAFGLLQERALHGVLMLPQLFLFIMLCSSCVLSYFMACTAVFATCNHEKGNVCNALHLRTAVQSIYYSSLLKTEIGIDSPWTFITVSYIVTDHVAITMHLSCWSDAVLHRWRARRWSNERCRH